MGTCQWGRGGGAASRDYALGWQCLYRKARRPASPKMCHPEKPTLPGKACFWSDPGVPPSLQGHPWAPSELLRLQLFTPLVLLALELLCARLTKGSCRTGEGWARQACLPFLIQMPACLTQRQNVLLFPLNQGSADFFFKSHIENNYSGPLGGSVS